MMINRAWMSMLLAIALLVGGCHAHVSTHGYASGPSLVWSDAHGVWVVENQAHPMFYADGFYWRFDNGRWFRAARFRSDSWARVQVSALPQALVRIEQPKRYARFEGPPDARRRSVEAAPEKDESRTDRSKKDRSKKDQSKKDRGVRPPGLGGQPPPGHGGEIPGKSGDAPGKSGDAPGKSGDAPGKSGDAPGKSGDAPGKSGDAPGKSGGAPGKSGGVPGKGAKKDKAAGKPNKPGRSGKSGGRGGKKGR